MRNRPARPSRARRRTLAGGLAIVAAYAALAAWSGSLTPLARGPLLDGLAPTSYRWVAPPPELEATNQEPSSGRFQLPLEADGVGTQVVFTSDSQVTVVIDDGSIGPSPGQRSVQLLVEPLDPAELADPDGELVAFGNAYSLTASFRPSGKPVRGLDRPIRTIMLYPATATLHSTRHEVVYSPDGNAWRSLETTDSPGLQQAEAMVPDLGYVMVAGVPAPAVSPSPGAGGSDTGLPPLAVALLVAAGVVLVIGIGLLIRSRAG